MSDDQHDSDIWLRRLIGAVASLALICALVAHIIGRDGQLTTISLMFTSVAGLVFGTKIINDKYK